MTDTAPRRPRPKKPRDDQAWARVAVADLIRQTMVMAEMAAARIKRNAERLGRQPGHDPPDPLDQ